MSYLNQWLNLQRGDVITTSGYKELVVTNIHDFEVWQNGVSELRKKIFTDKGWIEMTKTQMINQEIHVIDFINLPPNKEITLKD